MLREALSYPLRGEDVEETLLVGAVLALAIGLLVRLGVLGVLAVVPAVLLAGYALAVLRVSAESSGDTDAESARATLATDETPPAFAGLRALAGDGVRALVVAAGYLFVPAVALAVTVGGASAGVRPATLGTTAFVLVASTVVLVVSAVFAYLLPAALAGVARTGHLRSAVDLAALRRHATDGGYFVGWITALVACGVAFVLSGALASLGRPGEVVALAGGFYALVVVARLLGRGVGGSRG
jgi:hypothetical protein